MALLVSAQMSLRYARLFDHTVRAEYDRALDLARSHLGPLPAGRPTLPIEPVGTDWRDTPPSRPAGPAATAGAPRLKAPAPTPTSANTAPSFRTDVSHLGVLAAQRVDAAARGRGTETDRHRRLVVRLDTLIAQAQPGERQHPSTS